MILQSTVHWYWEKGGREEKEVEGEREVCICKEEIMTAIQKSKLEFGSHTTRQLWLFLLPFIW